MKLNHKFVRTVTTTAAVLGAAAMLSVGAFAAEADTTPRAAQSPRKNVMMIDTTDVFNEIHTGERSIFMPPELLSCLIPVR